MGHSGGCLRPAPFACELCTMPEALCIAARARQLPSRPALAGPLAPAARALWKEPSIAWPVSQASYAAAGCLAGHGAAAAAAAPHRTLPPLLPLPAVLIKGGIWKVGTLGVLLAWQQQQPRPSPLPLASGAALAAC